MKFSNKKLFFLALVTALGLRVSIACAYQIPGYVGNQSFDLSDDRDLNNLIQRAANAKMEYARIDQSKDQLQEQANTLSRQADEIKVSMDRLNTEIQEAKNSITALESKLSTLNENPEQNKDEITTTKDSIERFKTNIQNKTTNYSQLKLELGPINVHLDQIRHDLQDVTRRAEEARNIMIQANNQRESYERQLVQDIQNINRDGANHGNNDGQSDGNSLASSLGNNAGISDGNSDGDLKGTADGQDRDYRRGADQGDRDGSARAKIDGERDGTYLGTRDGNISAAQREGDAAGVIRGNASDAIKVGAAQGVKAGLEHAISQGRIDGEDKAESESLNKYETTPLSNVLLNGPFAGSFSRRSPTYPGDFNGSNYRPDVWANKDILKRAYADGYVYLYRQQTRSTFNNSIDSIYNRVYDSSYNTSYSNSFNKNYTDYYNKGRSDGDKLAYNRDYPIIKNNFYNDYFDRFNSNPNRNSSEFRSTYSASEASGYARRYEELRSNSFDKEELATYNANIKNQTEISRVRRVQEVEKIFNNNAILSFESSEMQDGGITSIAKLDGVFQPGEATLHNLILNNFGFKEANNVRVKLDNGVEVKLPTIPARSKIKIIGAGTSQIAANAKIGSNQKTSLKVLSTLTSDDAIEAIHFDKISGGELKSADVKSTTVQLPFSLANLGSESLLLKGIKNKLHITATNNSKRLYTGDLKIEILANSKSDLITKPFSTISTIASTKAIDLSDAEVLVATDADVYRDLSFSAKISQNGVMLGLLNIDFATMAKASYQDKSNLPVLLVDSNKDLDLLLDTLNDLGGTENVAILDTSLSSLNSSILNAGLIGKAIVVLDDPKSKTSATLNNFIAKSKSGFMLVNVDASALSTVAGLPSLSESQKLNLDKNVLLFTNPFRAQGVVGVSSVFASSKENLITNLEILSSLAMSSSDLVAKLKTQINRTSFFTPNNTIKVYSLKTLAEILNINIAYDKSGNIFSRDKKWAEMISNDATLFINQLKSAATGSVDEAKLGSVLPAIAMKDFVATAISDAFDISRKMMPKILNATNKVLGNSEDGYKKSLKDFNKDLYNKAYEKAAIHRPFYIEPKPTPN